MILPNLVGQLERNVREMQPLNSAIGLLSLVFFCLDALRASLVGVWYKQAFIPTWFSG